MPARAELSIASLILQSSFSVESEERGEREIEAYCTRLHYTHIESAVGRSWPARWARGGTATRMEGGREKEEEGTNETCLEIVAPRAKQRWLQRRIGLGKFDIWVDI